MMAMAIVATGERVVAADGAADADVNFFEARIRPVLVEHCYKCHSTEAKKSKAGLLVDTRESLRRGGDGGPAVVPGDPDKSLLFTAITHADPELKMPAKKPKLPDAVIADFRTWIQRGAADPRESTGPALAQAPTDLESGRKFWAYIKPVEPALPKVSDATWARRDLDRFVLAKLDAAGLAPRPDAAPGTLLRRLYFDLIGLPPSPEQLRDFLARVQADGLDAALEREVDALLASPRYGERWGRHWLDVARFAESSGKETNVTFPHAWRYRDYVIDAFNADVPYDRFITEQIAGDLLPTSSDAERARLMIATGFLAVGPKGLNEMNLFQALADVIDEQIDTVTRAITATTVACARCHDHKFDPFAMQDYYALAGVFVSTKPYYGTSVAPGNIFGGDLLVLPKLDEQLIPNQSIPPAKLAKLKEDLAAMKARGEELKKASMKAAAEGKDPTETVSLAEVLGLIWRSGGIEGTLKTVDDEGHALPLCMGVADRETMHDAPLLERGEIAKPGPKVPRGFPRIVDLPDVPAPPPDHSGRLELARWLTHPDHPLTSRVMVNRIWHYMLGSGIVETVDNFGFKGSRPTHPQLLDHLALRFIKQGWSVKAMVREIALSRTYRQASTFDADAFAKDPDNRLLWRANKRRLDAESIRDAMLFVSGQLDTSRRPGSLVATIGEKPVGIVGMIPYVPKDLDNSLRRSVYLPVLRDRLPDVLDLFDFAEPSMVTGARDTTNVPVQALYFMNSPFVMQRAEALSKRLCQETNDDDARVRNAFVHCFSRAPDAAERAMAERFFRELEAVGGARSKADVDVQAYANFCHALLGAAEFRYID
ncbi:MAG: DUF1553 domain-containing protein [Phycisphaera sp.]|nr:DUF1553 domain-containing protein [Phycisphaera sp.]